MRAAQSASFLLLPLAVAWLMTGGLATVASAYVSDASPTSTEHPNIILFLVDDLGWQDTSVAFHETETPFQAHFRTPHVERLARRGVRFVNAYSHCVCSPTRTSILTGMNPARHGVTNWTLYPDRDQSGKTGRLAAPADWRKDGWQDADVTLPTQLQSAGYQTIHCGKAHWGAIGTAGSDPENLGFDINIAGHSAGAPGSYQGHDNFGNHADGSPNPPWGVPGLEKFYGTGTHLTDALATEACAAIDQAVADQRPFFLYMAPYAVHTPLQPHERFIENYRGQMYPGTDIAIPENEAQYASMVEGYDTALGALLGKLNQLNIADRTIIVFTSDNGGLSVHSRGTTPRGTGPNTHCWPLREGKGSAYEGGTRVPMIVSWATPDAGSSLQKQIPIRGNAISRAHVISEDLMPTLCGWAGVTTLPDEVEGVDFTTALAESVDEPRQPVLLFHYPHVWGPAGDGYQPHSALRNGRWKVIYFYDPQRWELYDLETDIGEQGDLAATQPEKLAEMQQLLIEQLDARGAQYPAVIETGQSEPPRS
ncbi:MAG: sulfatase [Pirellulaceae bacterium]